jgi:hypothetical protein
MGDGINVYLALEHVGLERNTAGKQGKLIVWRPVSDDDKTWLILIVEIRMKAEYPDFSSRSSSLLS